MSVYKCPICGLWTSTAKAMAKHLIRKTDGKPHAGKETGYYRVDCDINLHDDQFLEE
jgi:hypothetical protein